MKNETYKNIFQHIATSIHFIIIVTRLHHPLPLFINAVTDTVSNAISAYVHYVDVVLSYVQVAGPSKASHGQVF